MWIRVMLGALLGQVVLIGVSVMIDRQPKPVGEQAWARRILLRWSVVAVSAVLTVVYLAAVAYRWCG